MKYFDTFRRWATILRVVEETEKKESRVGHTFVQKLTYLIQELFGIPLGYVFYLYYYGPYSDEVWSDLTAMRDAGFLSIMADPDGYGYWIKITGKNEWINEKVTDLPEDKIQKLVGLLKDQPVWILELIATTHFVYKDLKKKNKFSTDALVDALCSLKPHFDKRQVESAFKIIRKIEQ